MQIPELLLAQRWEEVGCFALCFLLQPSRLQLLVLLNFVKAGKNITYLVPIVLGVAPQCAPLLRGCQGGDGGC